MLGQDRIFANLLLTTILVGLGFQRESLAGENRVIHVQSGEKTSFPSPSYVSFEAQVIILRGHALTRTDYAELPHELKDMAELQQRLQRDMAKRQQLLHRAKQYAQRSEIPYIWGGRSAGTRLECLACRRCVKKLADDVLEERRQRCEPCQRCGVDCSNFVNLLYDDVGLDYPFASTSVLLASSRQQLRQEYQLVDLGTDLSIAKPGDLLVHDRHMTMLLRYDGHGIGDFIHVTRLGDSKRLGRIEVRRQEHLPTYRGGLKRILRHVTFYHEEPFSTSNHGTKSENAPGVEVDAGRNIGRHVGRNG